MRDSSRSERVYRQCQGHGKSAAMNCREVLDCLRENRPRYGANSTCLQAAGRSDILGPGRPFEGIEPGFDGVGSGLTCTVALSNQ